MNALADAFVFATAYLSAAPADDEREDADCSALESIGAILSHASPPERQALREATERAISQESASSTPREEWLAAYQAIVESYTQ